MEAATVLCLLSRKLAIHEEEPTNAREVLQRVDDFLSLLGLSEVSVVRLWENAGRLVRQTDQDRLFRSVMSALRTVHRECSSSAALTR